MCNRCNLSFRNFILISFSLLVLINCGGNDEPVLSQEDLDKELIIDYFTNNNLDTTNTISSIYYEIIQSNPTGKVQQVDGKILSIYYKSKVLEGADIEDISNDGANKPVMLKQGVGAIYPIGLDIALALMKEGEIFKFFIPSKLAYGELSFDSVIPENAIIEIEIELVEIQNEETLLITELKTIEDYVISNALNDTINNPLDSVDILITGESYKKLIAGDKDNIPLQSQLITINYTGKFLNGNLFDASAGNSFSFVFGTGEIISGLENGIAQMERGERALIIIPSAQGYKESVMYIPSFLGLEFEKERIIPMYSVKVPPYQVLVFDVTLLN